jgi:septal ring factor EnvC (AmiA/AmiB activator)
MAAETTKRIIEELKKESPEVHVSDRRYKKAYSETLWALVEEIVKENDSLNKRLDIMESMANTMRNQLELTSSELKQARKQVDFSNSRLKSLPRRTEEAREAREAEEVDLKGE